MSSARVIEEIAMRLAFALKVASTSTGAGASNPHRPDARRTGGELSPHLDGHRDL